MQNAISDSRTNVSVDFPAELPFEAPAPFLANDFSFRVARTPAEVDGFWRLRTQVFCYEQQLFDGSDRDQCDDEMIPLVCMSRLMGMNDGVVGAVRIWDAGCDVWSGGRLCVEKAYWRIVAFSPGVAASHQLPPAWHSVGAGLVYAAVTSAHAKGCKKFVATIQSQNAKFFNSLHWDIFEELELLGRPHVKVQADLRYYPPSDIFDVP